MSRTSLVFTILAVFCLSTSFAQTGNVTVNVTNTTTLNNTATVNQQVVDFTYDALEWSGANWENEWAFAESGEGEFVLTNSNGDEIIIDAINNNNNAYLDDILGEVVPSQAGGNTTIASNIGNSISAGIQQTANKAHTVVNNAAPAAAAAPVVAAVLPPVVTVVAEQPQNENEVVIAEYVPLEVALGPAPFEVVITEQTNADGSVTTNVTKYYYAAAPSNSANVQTVQVQPEAVQVQPEVVEVQPEVVAVQPVVITTQPEAATNAVEVENQNVESQETPALQVVPLSAVEGLEATEVLTTEQVNANGTVTTTVTRYYTLNATQAGNAGNNQEVAVENSQQQ